MERSDRWLSLTLRTGLLGLFFWMVKGILTPVILGGLFALLISPLQRRLAPRLGRFQRFAPALMTIGAMILVVVPFVFIGIEAVASINQFIGKDWTKTLERVQAFSSENLAWITEKLGLSSENVRNYTQNVVRQAGGMVAGFAGRFASAVPESIIDLFLFVVSLYYFLRDGRALARWLVRFSPFKHDETEELFASIHGTVNGAILGLLATAAAQGALTTISLFVFEVPGAFLFGIIATLLAFIPMIGTTPVTVGAAIYLIAIGRIGAAVGMGIAAVVIGLVDNVIRPWVQSSHGGMHPLIALLAIFGGLELFGPTGVFVGPVIAAMAIWTVDTYANLRQKHAERDSSPPKSGAAETPS